MAWLQTITETSSPVIESLKITGTPDLAEKSGWMATAQNGLLITASNLTIRHLELSHLHVGVEIRGDNVTVESWSADMISGDIFQGNGNKVRILRGWVTNLLAVFPFEEYHPDIVHFRSGSGGIVDGIEVIPSTHPWARTNYQGCMFSDNAFRNWTIRNLKLPGVHPEHAVTFSEAHCCHVESVWGGGAVRFRSLNGQPSTHCVAVDVDGPVEGGQKVNNYERGKPMIHDDFDQEELNNDLFLVAAERVGVEVELLEALADQEGLRKPFYNGHPTKLFEPHIFTQLLNQSEFDIMKLLQKRPDLSEIITYKKPERYGSYAKQHERFQLARSVNEEAAIGACSWGMFSVMGYHWKALGYVSARELMQEAYSQAGQFRLLLGYLEKVEPQSLEALRNKQWARFKVLYNGPAKNDYAAELAQRYRRALARRAPKKSLRKGHSRTVNAQVADVGVKVGSLVAVNTALQDIQSQIEALKSIKSEVEQLATATAQQINWNSWALVILALIVFWPNIRSLYAYLHDNGYINLQYWK